jgi:hypothetical protein
MQALNLKEFTVIPGLRPGFLRKFTVSQRLFRVLGPKSRKFFGNRPLGHPLAALQWG